MIALVTLLLGLLTIASAAHGAGELDPTFDGDGRVVTSFGGNDRLASVAIQADGKIIATGSCAANSAAPSECTPTPPNFALARYNPDGSLDPTFDGDGMVVTDFGGRGEESANDVAIQADGKIVVAGDSAGPGPSDFALARYNPDGSLDPTFDGDGKVVTDFGAVDFALGVAIQTDGRIVAAGQSSGDFALARYNPDGSLDPTFDGDGRVVTDFGAECGFPVSGFCGAGDVAIEAGGRIVAAGRNGDGPNPSNFALATTPKEASTPPSTATARWLPTSVARTSPLVSRSRRMASL